MRGSSVRLAVVVAAAVACAALVPMVAVSRGEDPAPREIAIVAKNMTFYVNGAKSPNPTLRFRAGERVRLVLRNEDAGMVHDFSIKAWNVATKSLAEKGQEDSVVFRVPKNRTGAAYQCTPHSEMMRGSIQVE